MLPARRVPRLQHLSCIPCPESKAGCPKGQDSNLLGQAHRCRTVCGGASHQSVTLNLSGAAPVFPCARIQEPDSSLARGLSAPLCRSFFPSQQAIRTSLHSGERPERDLNPSVLLVHVPAALWLRNRCPTFASEAEEAEWWYNHRDEISKAFADAAARGELRTGSAARLAR